MNAVVQPEPRAVVATDITPMRMLQVAVEQGADLDKLQKLMDLHERWEASQARKAFDAAISAARGEMPVIAKNATVDFTSQKGRTSYRYEDFGQIARQIDPILSKHGLSYRFRSHQDGKLITVTCIVSHSAGHSEETSLFGAADESGNKNSIQAVGSTVTYLQRYTLKLALGLAASKDDDARGAEPQQTGQAAPAGYDDWREDMTEIAGEGMERLKAAWSGSSAEFRKHAATHDAEWWAQMKASAAKVRE